VGVLGGRWCAVMNGGGSGEGRRTLAAVMGGGKKSVSCLVTAIDKQMFVWQWVCAK
jgi:hypothetical protein